MKSYLLSVVIPSYNEIANLRKGTLDKVEHYLERKKYNYEVIVVDDGSDDGSLEFVREFVKENPKFRIIENNNTGKAGAVTAGVLQGQGDYILFSDMDQATPIEEVEKLLAASEEGFDIAIGSRSTVRKGSPFTRLVISRSTIILRKLLVGMNSLTDTQCGFKMFSKKAARDIFMKVREVHNGFKSIHGSPEIKEYLVRNIIKNNCYSEENTVFVGDSMTDYQAAKASGIAFYGINNNSLQPIADRYIFSFKTDDVC